MSKRLITIENKLDAAGVAAQDASDAFTEILARAEGGLAPRKADVQALLREVSRARRFLDAVEKTAASLA